MKKDVPALDKKDFLILFELEQDSCQSLNEIAKKVLLSKETVFHRIKRLEKSGIIKKYITAIDVFMLGYRYHHILLKFSNTKPAIEREIVLSLKGSRFVAWLTVCEGYWDVNLTVATKNDSELTSFLNAFLEKYGDFISEKQIFIGTEIHYFKRSFLTGKEAGEVVSITGKKKIELDEKDNDLLKVLSSESRMPAVQLAQKLESTPRVVNYRIKKLKEKEIILDMRIMTDFAKLGYKFYKIWFSLKGMDGKRWQKLLSYCRKTEMIIWATKLIGYYDFSIEMEVKDVNEFRSVLEGIKELFSENINRHESLLMFSEEKMTHLPGSRV